MINTMDAHPTSPVRPQSASAVHGVRFSDEEWRPGSAGSGILRGDAMRMSPMALGRPRSAMDLRREPPRDQLRPTSAGSCPTAPLSDR